MDPVLLDRFRGSLLGLAVGDAVGTTVEFEQPGTFPPATDMVGGGPFDLAPGQWTDDTSMALCLAESLISVRGFDPADQMTRYVRWYKDGHLSSTGACFDIGSTTRGALERFMVDPSQPYAGPASPRAAGNGSLMRLAPVVLAYTPDATRAVQRAADSSRTTHAARTAVDSCRYFAGLLLGALNGVDKASLLDGLFFPVPGLWSSQPLCPEVEAVARGTFLHKEPPAIQGSGYVVQSLEAALWAFSRSNTFEEGCLLAVNLGDDADTTAAVYGQLAGAYYGVSGIPSHWLERLHARDMILNFADHLFDLAGVID